MGDGTVLSRAALRGETRAAAANPEQARVAHSVFKPDPGQYGEGDRFLGIRVPGLRTIARKYAALSLRDVETLRQSKWHEEKTIVDGSAPRIVGTQIAIARPRGSSSGSTL